MAVSFEKATGKGSAPATGISVTKPVTAPAPPPDGIPVPPHSSRPTAAAPHTADHRSSERTPQPPRPHLPPPAPDSGERGAPSPPKPANRRHGRVALATAFLLGATVVGCIGYATTAEAGAQGRQAQQRFEAAQRQVKEAEAKAAGVQDTLTAVQGRLDEASKQLSQERSKAAGVAQEAGRAKSELANAASRLKEVTAAEKAVAKREKAVASREAALNSYDAGHELLDSIDGDGTWVVGRDIKAGTWSSSANDTGCTWRVSDGRHGAGDGSYDMMEVPVSIGQKFTVHGCTLWGNYSY